MREMCVEIINFNLLEGTENITALEGFKSLDSFYRSQEGYHGMNAAQVDADAWTLILYWNSKQDEKQASGRMMSSNETDGFKRLVIPKTVEKKIYPGFTLGVDSLAPVI